MKIALLLSAWYIVVCTCPFIVFLKLYTSSPRLSVSQTFVLKRWDMLWADVRSVFCCFPIFVLRTSNDRTVFLISWTILATLDRWVASISKVKSQSASDVKKQIEISQVRDFSFWMLLIHVLFSYLKISKYKV